MVTMSTGNYEEHATLVCDNHERRPTLLYNGYGAYVTHLYKA